MWRLAEQQGQWRAEQLAVEQRSSSKQTAEQQQASSVEGETMSCQPEQGKSQPPCPACFSLILDGNEHQIV